MEQLKPIIDLFKYHKLKILMVFVAFLVYAVLMFPRDDLKEFVIKFAYQSYGIELDFDELSIIPVPTPNVRMNNVSASIPGAGDIRADSLNVSPSLKTIFLSVFTNNAEISIDAEGLFGGDVEADIAFENSGLLEYTADLQNTSVASIMELVPVPISAKGRVNLISAGTYDLTNTSPPNIQLELNSTDFQLLSLIVPTQMGPLPLPPLSLRQMVIAGRWEEGKIHLDDVRLGREGDDLEGTIKGEMNLDVSQSGRARIGNFRFQFRLGVSPNVEKQLEAIIGLMDLQRFKSGGKYNFEVSGNPTRMPKFSRL